MIYLFLFLLGLCFGSFVSAFSYRYLKGISIAKGRSFCPKCKNKISWFDNIPVLSFIFLGGRCRSCKKKISLRYPMIELSSALGFLVIGIYTLPDYVKTIYYLTIFVLLAIIFVTDLENQVIPDVFIFMGIVVTLGYFILINPQSMFLPIFSGLLAASFLMLIHVVTKGQGMGLGDVKFAVLGGMIVGFDLLPIWILLAFLTGAIVGSILILLRKARMKTKIAFGPFLIVSIVLALAFGKNILWII